MSSKSSVDGARGSVDHSNSGIMTTESATNSSTTADDSNCARGSTKTKTATEKCGTTF